MTKIIIRKFKIYILIVQILYNCIFHKIKWDKDKYIIFK